MADRAFLVRAEPGFSLPVLERLAPPPPPDLVAAAIDRQSAPGDVVVDLHGRGGWIGRAAIDRQRRALSVESLPLTRLLAELVLRPPDVRHLEAAFQALAASPRGETSLRLAIGELFATRCATCGRTLIADEIIWVTPTPGGDETRRVPNGPPVPIRKHYRCAVCRDQQGGGEQRHADLDHDDRLRAATAPGVELVRRALIDRFPLPDGAAGLADQFLDLHTDRQLVGLAAILDRIESDLRAEPIEAALRLAFVHAVLPASRLAVYPGRLATLRVVGGQVRPPGGGQWRERNPWLAFEDAFRTVRGFIQRLTAGTPGPIQARFGEDLRSLGEGPATAVVRLAGPVALRDLAAESGDLAHRPGRPRVRLILGQPPLRWSQDRLVLAFHATAWGLGRDSAASLPLEPLAGPALRAPWGWQSAALRRSLEALAPSVERDGRAILLLEPGGPEALIAAVLGGVGAGYRLLGAQLAEPDADHGGVVELVPPGAALPPAARSRANQTLAAVPGGAGDPEVVPGRGLFAPPERFDARPFSSSDAARTVTETAIEVLRARGEPARTERLLGEILVGLDRAGQLRRLAEADEVTAGAGESRDRDVTMGTSARSSTVVPDAGAGVQPGPEPQPATPTAARLTPPERAPDAAGSIRAARSAASPGGLRRVRGHGLELAARPDQVERLVALIRDELGRQSQRRLVEIEPGRWWLADRDDVVAAAAPLADRVEWAVYSLLSTAGPLSETAFFERMAALFSGPDLPDETLVRACLDSYRSLASTADRLVTGEDLPRRSHEHTELLAALAEGGHRLGLQVWLGSREQSRRLGARRLADWLDDRERNVHLPLVARGPADDVSAVDCIWYVRSRATFLFEVEWTAMLGETLLRRHARIPQEERIVRFLVVPPERTELVRHKLDRSPLVRAALETGNWHILKWNHLRSFLAADRLDLADLEPYLGLDPVVERSGEQLPLFDAERYP